MTNLLSRLGIRGGSLVLIAVLMLGSAVLRLGFEAGPALAREVSEVSPKPVTDHGDSATEDLGTVLAAFQKRDQRLKAREMEIEDRMHALAIADAAIEKKLLDLTIAEQRLRETIAMADGAAENDIARLTSVFEKMKPKGAAALFEEMDPAFAAGFLGRMKPENAASILASLTPNAAYTISVVLAGRNANGPKT